MINIVTISLFLIISCELLLAQKMLTPCMSCQELAGVQLPDVQIDSTVTKANPAEHCRVYGVIGKEIGFEVALPATWNQRFSMSGNGGFAGSIQTGHHRVRQGFANAATDTGHKGDPLDGSWAMDQPERQLNFGHLAVHRTTETAKAFIRHYYGMNPKYSYFVGCSRGGGQAMMAAQRYPDDYDGIIAGAPAFTWTGMAAEFIQNCQAIFPEADNLTKRMLSPGHLQVLHREVLHQCDDLDGLRDNILNDPRDCAIDFSKLPACQNAHPDSLCFTMDQINVIKTIYAGVHLNDSTIYPGFPAGGEGLRRGWKAWITGPDESANAPSKHAIFAQDIFRYFVYHDPAWTFNSYRLENFVSDTRFASRILDASSIDYTAFKARQGKMIIYHGWNDPALSALATLDHYESATQNDPQLNDYIRLFLLPGVLHCGGGPGPSSTSWIEYLQAWVERGEAPDQILVSGKADTGEQRVRPVFPYPEKAVYNGIGDPNVPESFIRMHPK